jgi:tetratricopeptide (TPR) repeat protein
LRLRWQRLAARLVFASLAPLAAAGDTITLTNGRVIQADRAWFEGSQLLYEKSGATFGLPRSLVKSVEPTALPQPSPKPEDPAVVRARELLSAGRDDLAIKELRELLARDPRQIAALQALCEAYLHKGDTRAAADAAEKAVRLDERDARSRALLGDALLALGNLSGAAVEFRASLKLKPDPTVQKKLEAIAAPPPSSASAPGAQFRLRYDGGVNEPLGVAVLQTLTEAFAEFAARLGYTPPDPVTVILQTESEFEESGAPVWAEGIYDGTVRIPVRGVEKKTPRLHALLRHELAHSFLTARTAGNCPTWVQEGVAQWLEGGDPSRADASLAARARAGTLFPLLTLEAPFQNLAPGDAPVAYAESLSGIAHLLRLRGETGLSRLLAALGDGLPSEEALPVAIGMSYAEFERSWETRLRGIPKP